MSLSVGLTRPTCATVNIEPNKIHRIHLMYFMQYGKRIYTLLVTKNIVCMFANERTSLHKTVFAFKVLGSVLRSVTVAQPL